jgi:hypothetical protein
VIGALAGPAAALLSWALQQHQLLWRLLLLRHDASCRQRQALLLQLHQLLLLQLHQLLLLLQVQKRLTRSLSVCLALTLWQLLLGKHVWYSHAELQMALLLWQQQQ